MVSGDVTDDAIVSSWHWYVLLGYPTLSVLGVLSIGRLTGGSLVASSAGSVALVIVMTAVGLVSLPAIWRDVAFVREDCAGWMPEEHVYVGPPIVATVGFGLLGGLTGGLGVAIAFAVFAFLVSSVTASLAYLYNRHRTIGVLTR
ncbi:hypothetical protein OB955_17235 [Halobacteria archaeon AArc-m2/3/4]|uniref:Uncharacterized protein n=1 Tax=Natronoglomus mannanivorans TaxID=2979990 RepID=A0AAP2YYX5_9EURY|nr:hypothetical protein [Halobacteria archaeon AArc-xg1-1]MCU4974467.1 hypothetical protein [Halobacteria archaeon AArc-m2/3/4]